MQTAYITLDGNYLTNQLYRDSSGLLLKLLTATLISRGWQPVTFAPYSTIYTEEP